MDSSGGRFPSDGPSPRRELQGPRPAPLKVRKDSHKIKKPPVAPPARQPTGPPPPQHRPPVIIYSVSPKVIHAAPSEFMSLVQRLTGVGSSSTSADAPPDHPYVLQPHADTSGGEVHSAAARIAAYEMAAQVPEGGERMWRCNQDHVLLSDQLRIHGSRSTLDQPVSLFPGILSPVPSSLPAISPDLFSPPASQNQINLFHELSPAMLRILSPVPSSLPAISPDLFSPPASQNQINLFHELSPAMHRSRNFMDQNSFLNSPSNVLYTPVIPSPGAYWDLFNQYQDL